MNSKIETVSDLLNVEDRKAFEREVGVSTQLVTRALADQAMPPRWFVAVREFCDRRNVAVPEHLFKWHSASPPPSPENAGAS